MKVLITGATGFLGNNVARTLLAMGHSVRAYVRPRADTTPIGDLNVEIAHGELGEINALSDAIKGVDVVVHAAASIHIGRTQLETQRRVNVDGTANVARASRMANVRMLHISSVDALGLGFRGQPADEDTPREGMPYCGYVVTKREAEDVVRREMAAGLDAVIVNPGFMLGPWDWKPSSGKMIIEVVRSRPLFAASGGCSVCDVRDVAQGIVTAIQQAKPGSQYILAGQNILYIELWSRFCDLAGVRRPKIRVGPLVRIVAGRFGDLWGICTGHEPNINSAAAAMSACLHYYSSAKAQRDLGYSVRPLESTLRDSWDWLTERGLLVRN